MVVEAVVDFTVALKEQELLVLVEKVVVEMLILAALIQVLLEEMVLVVEAVDQEHIIQLMAVMVALELL